jgi:serine phosphatase RsbU (regulator of sigma subunit)
MVGAIRTLIEYTRDPIAILQGLNRRLIGRTDGGFATCLVLHVTTAGGVTMGNAGHLAPFLNGIEMAMPGSLPLGLSPDAEFEMSRFLLAEDDEVTLYTDGVLEAQSKTGELFGFDRTKTLMRDRPTVQAVAEAARQFGQKDDITVVKIMRVHPEDARNRISVDLQTIAIKTMEAVA